MQKWTFGTKEISDTPPLLDRAAVFEPLSSFSPNHPGPVLSIDLLHFGLSRPLSVEDLFYTFNLVYPRVCSFVHPHDTRSLLL